MENKLLEMAKETWPHADVALNTETRDVQGFRWEFLNIVAEAAEDSFIHAGKDGVNRTIDDMVRIRKAARAAGWRHVSLVPVVRRGSGDVVEARVRLRRPAK